MFDFFSGRQNPMFVNIRINAGLTPKDKWQQDPEIGGGRIIGDVCHFLDLSNFLVKSSPKQIFATSVSSNREDLIEEDNCSILIKYLDGSLANISYVHNQIESYLSCIRMALIYFTCLFYLLLLLYAE